MHVSSDLIENVLYSEKFKSKGYQEMIFKLYTDIVKYAVSEYVMLMTEHQQRIVDYLEAFGVNEIKGLNNSITVDGDHETVIVKTIFPKLSDQPELLAVKRLVFNDCILTLQSADWRLSSFGTMTLYPHQIDYDKEVTCDSMETTLVYVETE